MAEAQEDLAGGWRATYPTIPLHTRAGCGQRQPYKAVAARLTASNWNLIARVQYNEIGACKASYSHVTKAGAKPLRSATLGHSQGRAQSRVQAGGRGGTGVRAGADAALAEPATGSGSAHPARPTMNWFVVRPGLVAAVTGRTMLIFSRNAARLPRAGRRRCCRT